MPFSESLSAAALIASGTLHIVLINFSDPPVTALPLILAFSPLPGSASKSAASYAVMLSSLLLSTAVMPDFLPLSPVLILFGMPMYPDAATAFSCESFAPGTSAALPSSLTM